MIHQHIFASPKPGLTEAEFQDYWLNVHAVKFASKITQIKRYKIDLRVAIAADPSPIWNGIAEIWLKDEADQLASLQSSAFLDGARADEPRWAAFWNTLGLDCDTTTIGDRWEGATPPDGATKLVVLYRRGSGLTLQGYRDRHLNDLAQRVAALPGVLRHDLSFTRDALYLVGMPRFDAICQVWFESQAEAEAALAGIPARRLLLPDDDTTVDPDQVFWMLTREHWVIGPDARA